jgi:ubiquinone biosynthesis monooxygenase Coq7
VIGARIGIVKQRDVTDLDRALMLADTALRALTGSFAATRPVPAATAAPETLTAAEKDLSGALMRVNHVGEVCAQALYTAQAMGTRDTALRAQLEQAAREETDHLAWTQQRLDELGSRPSLLNPLWYAGAFAMGLVAGRIGDRVSLGFIVETERQVEAHLEGHLDRLPAADHASRAIVAQMKEDEAAHANHAQAQGAVDLPAPVKLAMRAAAKVMTTTAHYI